MSIEDAAQWDHEKLLKNYKLYRLECEDMEIVAERRFRAISHQMKLIEVLTEEVKSLQERLQKLGEEPSG